jgi:catechol 2,3-dioxygenase-like lactoylglutathione lyase family enzyme
MRIDHVAHLCRDPQETHRFYNGVLGLELVQAYAGKELLLVYALPGGGSLVFSASRDSATTVAADLVPWERQHVGITVDNRAELDRWLERLREHGIHHQLIDDERVYFADPDGLVLELEVASSTPVNRAAFEILARWPQCR